MYIVEYNCLFNLIFFSPSSSSSYFLLTLARSHFLLRSYLLFFVSLQNGKKTWISFTPPPHPFFSATLFVYFIFILFFSLNSMFMRNLIWIFYFSEFFRCLSFSQQNWNSEKKSLLTCEIYRKNTVPGISRVLIVSDYGTCE